MKQNKLGELPFDDLPPVNIGEYIEYESTLEREFTFICKQLERLNTILKNSSDEVIISDTIHTNFSKNYIEGLAKINIYSAIGDNIYLLDKLKEVQSKIFRKCNKAI